MAGKRSATLRQRLRVVESQSAHQRIPFRAGVIVTSCLSLLGFGRGGVEYPRLESPDVALFVDSEAERAFLKETVIAL